MRSPNNFLAPSNLYEISSMKNLTSLRKAMDARRLVSGFFALFILIFFTSCLPEVDEGIEQPFMPVQGLQAANNFDWKTSREIEITIRGLSINLGVTRRLTLLFDDGTLFYSGNQSMSEDFIMGFELPNHVKKIRMRYGDLDQLEEVIGSKVSFDFLGDADESDIE